MKKMIIFTVLLSISITNIYAQSFVEVDKVIEENKTPIWNLFKSSIVDSDNYSDGEKGEESIKSLNPDRIIQELFFLYKKFDINHHENMVKIKQLNIVPRDDGTIFIKSRAKYGKITLDKFSKLRTLSQSVFRATSSATKATAFLVGDNLVLTNEHVVHAYNKHGERLNSKRFSCNSFSISTNPIIDRSNPKIPKHGGSRTFSASCKTVHYCDYAYDFCLVEMKPIRIRGKKFELGDIFTPLTLDPTGATPGQEEVSIISNANAAGIQGSIGIGLKKETAAYQRSGHDAIIHALRFTHFAPALKGSSGSPLLNSSDKVIGINHSQSKKVYGKDAKNFGAPIRKTLEILQQELGQSNPELLERINKQ